MPNSKFTYSHNGVEQKYKAELKKVIIEIDKIINSFKKKFGTNIDKKDVKQLTDKLNSYSSKLSGWAKQTVSKIFAQIDYKDKQAWEQNSKRMSAAMKHELLKTKTGTILKQYQNENVDLITSLPISAAERIHDIVFKNIYTGKKRASTVAQEIMKTGEVTQSRANTIARTETSRVANSLIQARAEQLEINAYRWVSSHDLKVRKAHKLMDGVICFFDDPPSPEELANEKSYGRYIPGGIFNCRCYIDCIFSIKDISWPAKVYSNGKIKTMNQQEFIKLSEKKFGLKEAA
jgi:SPP1 gp7 family putative phage head morphogenesis protein